MSESRERTLAMIAACFKHQHPEQFGGETIQEVEVPRRREEVDSTGVVPQQHDGIMDGYVPIGTGSAEVIPAWD